MFIFPLISYTSLFSIAGICINYIIDKYILLRRCKRPDYLSGELAIAIVYLFGFGWLNYILGNLIFTFDFKTEETSSKIKIIILIFVTLSGILIENTITETSLNNLRKE